jgi:hypothetical protein
MATGTIRLDAEGASFYQGESERQLTWQEVQRVLAFKRDELTTDLVCLSFISGGSASVEVNEEMEGWDDLLGALPVALPGAMSSDEIYSSVMAPAFVTKETVVFERHAA